MSLDMYDKDFIMDTKVDKKPENSINEAFTRQHYIKIADVIKKMKGVEDKESVTDALVEFFKNDNKLFDEQRFRKYIKEDASVTLKKKKNALTEAKEEKYMLEVLADVVLDYLSSQILKNPKQFQKFLKLWEFDDDVTVKGGISSYNDKISIQFNVPSPKKTVTVEVEAKIK